MSKKLLHFITVMFVAFGLLLTTSPALADGSTKSNGKFEGIISAVGSSSITVTPRKGGADITVNVDGTTRIKRNGKTALITDLLVGDKVEVKYDKTTMLASKIEAKIKKAQGGSNSNSTRSEVNGLIASVGANSVTITPRSGGANVTITVDSSTLIKREHMGTITLADLKVGDKVEAKFNSTTMLASKIEAN